MALTAALAVTAISGADAGSARSSALAPVETGAEPVAGIAHRVLDPVRRAFRFRLPVLRSRQVVPPCPSHAAQVALEPHGRGEHDDHSEEAGDDRLAVEGDEDHHTEDEGDGGPLAVAAGGPVDGLRAPPLRKLGLLGNQGLLELSQNALFVVRKRHYHLPPGISTSTLATCWHASWTRTTRMCAPAPACTTVSTAPQLRTRSQVCERGHRLAMLPRVPPRRRGCPTAPPGRAPGAGPLLLRLGLAPHDQERDQRPEQARNQNDENQRRLAVEDPEVDLPPPGVGHREPPQHDDDRDNGDQADLAPAVDPLLAAAIRLHLTGLRMNRASRHAAILPCRGPPPRAGPT